MNRPPQHKTNECAYTEKERLKEQFINIHDDDMRTKAVEELTIISKTNEITSKLILVWVRRVEEHKKH